MCERSSASWGRPGATTRWSVLARLGSSRRLRLEAAEQGDAEHDYGDADDLNGREPIAKSAKPAISASPETRTSGNARRVNLSRDVSASGIAIRRMPATRAGKSAQTSGSSA